MRLGLQISKYGPGGNYRCNYTSTLTYNAVTATYVVKKHPSCPSRDKMTWINELVYVFLPLYLIGQWGNKSL